MDQEQHVINVALTLKRREQFMWLEPRRQEYCNYESKMKSLSTDLLIIIQISYDLVFVTECLIFVAQQEQLFI